MNTYRENAKLRIQIEQLRKRKETYQEQLIDIRAKISSIIDLNYDKIKDIQMAFSAEGGEKTQSLADFFTKLKYMADDLYVGRGDSLIFKASDKIDFKPKNDD